MKSPVNSFLERIYANCKNEDSGNLADYIPELASVDPHRFAISLCTPDGTVYSAGDSDALFSIQSVSKPFAYALALRECGYDAVMAAVGVEPSGDAYNEASLQEGTGRPDNPMINIGAIATHGVLRQAVGWEGVYSGLCEFAGRELEIDEAVYESEVSTGWRNLALASLVRANGIFDADPHQVFAGYIRQCAAKVTVNDLSVMAMTLASGGINPVTERRVIPEWVARQVLSVMTTCGMYDAAGDWLTGIGIPAKSGVGGGLVGALPGQVGISAFSPRLDSYGHSVRGVKAFQKMSEQLNLHIMATPASSVEAVSQRSTTLDGDTLIEIQGVLDFSTTEMVLRHLEQIEQDDSDIVFDVSFVSAIPTVGGELMAEALRRLAAEGHDITIVDPHGRLPHKITARFDLLEERPEGYVDGLEVQEWEEA